MKRTAFTILEVIIVIVILAIMASIAGVSFTNSFNKAADQEASTKLDMIIAAEEIYRMNAGEYYAGLTNEGINANLNLQLPDDDEGNWRYRVFVADGPPAVACAQAILLNRGTGCWELCTNTLRPEAIDCP